MLNPQYTATTSRGTETFTHECMSPCSNADQARIFDGKLFQSWLNRLDPSIIIKHVIIQSVDYFGHGEKKRIGFLKFNATLTDGDGNSYPGIVFLRGEVISILPVISCGDKAFTLLVEQMRIPTGMVLKEVPAGMVDEDMTFEDTVGKELEEETGLKAEDGQIIDITGSEGPIYFSPGSSDARGYFFLYLATLTSEQLAELDGKTTGEHGTDERIKLRVIPLDDLLLKSRDGKTLMAMALYHRWAVEHLAATFEKAPGSGR